MEDSRVAEEGAQLCRNSYRIVGLYVPSQDQWETSGLSGSSRARPHDPCDNVF